nr:olfactory receptor-like protein OLF3 [Manis javanica]
MDTDNQTWVREFILLGLSRDWDTQVCLFVLFLVMYLATVLGNFLIVLLIRLDSRLHTPMYFFLSNLALVDVSYATSIVPQMLVYLLAEHKAVSFVNCAAQLFFSLGLGGIEFVLLAMMAYDRYVAVCDPLRYSVMMHGGLCARLVTVSLVSGSVNALMQTAITFQLPMCMNKYIDHISCELLAVVRLACVDTSSNEVAIMVSSIILLMTPFCLVLLSYIQIISTILKIQSTEGRRKAFHTCASHLTVVALCYGMAIFTYTQPRSSPAVLQETLISLFYAILTPMLNPMIYSLRSKEMKGAWKKLLGELSGLMSKLATWWIPSIIWRKELCLCVLPLNSDETGISCIAPATRSGMRKCVLVTQGRRLSGWVGVWEVGAFVCFRSCAVGLYTVVIELPS